MWIIRLLATPSSAGSWKHSGYTVGIISQPDWKDEEQHHGTGRAKAGLPGIGGKHGFHGEPLFGVQKSREERIPCTPGGVMGKRPDHARVVYCNLIRSVL